MHYQHISRITSLYITRPILPIHLSSQYQTQTSTLPHRHKNPKDVTLGFRPHWQLLRRDTLEKLPQPVDIRKVSRLTDRKTSRGPRGPHSLVPRSAIVSREIPRGCGGDQWGEGRVDTERVRFLGLNDLLFAFIAGVSLIYWWVEGFCVAHAIVQGVLDNNFWLEKFSWFD